MDKSNLYTVALSLLIIGLLVISTLMLGCTGESSPSVDPEEIQTTQHTGELTDIEIGNNYYFVEIDDRSMYVLHGSVQPVTNLVIGNNYSFQYGTAENGYMYIFSMTNRG